MISDRVKHARVYHGWSQDHLASLIGRSQSAIAQIEKGGQASPDTLAAIAEKTQFSLAFFNKGNLPDLPDGSLRFRKRAAATVRDSDQIRAHVRQTVEVIQELKESTPAHAVRIRPVPADAEVDEDFIEKLAVTARTWLGVGSSDPIPNLTRAVERAGVVVIGSSQEIEKHEGASYWADWPTGRPIICLTRSRAGDGNRFSLGHELGHLLLHQTRATEVEPKDAENEAHRFAGALLIPRDVAIDQIETPVTLKDLAVVKSRFGISIRALIRRCLDLGIITAERRTSLEKQISARGWHREEPVHVPDEHPVLLREFIRESFGTDNPVRLHGLLGLPPLAIRDMIT